MAGGAGIRARFKVNAEVFLREVGCGGSARHLGYSNTLSFNKGLASDAIPVGTIPDSLLHLNTRVVFALLYQLQGPGSIRSIASQDIDSSNEL